MTRETKVGLLAGMALILLIGILVSDHLSVGQDNPAILTEFAPTQAGSVRATPPPTSADPPAAAQRIARTGGIEPPAPERPDRQDAPQTMPPERVIPLVGEAPPKQTIIPQPPRRSGPAEGPAGFSPVTPEPPVNRDGRETAPQVLPSRPVPVQRQYHRVRAGETMGIIAQTYYGTSKLWIDIQKANPKKIGRDGLVRHGTRILIPDIDPARLLEVAPPRDAATDRDAATSLPAGTVKVEPGQTLSELAQVHLGSSRHAERLFQANRDQLKHRDQLSVGMVLRLPKTPVPKPPAVSRRPARSTPSTSGRSYTVKPGDTLSSIAEELLGGANQWRRLHAANRKRLKDPDVLVPGTELTVPKGAE